MVRFALIFTLIQLWSGLLHGNTTKPDSSVVSHSWGANIFSGMLHSPSDLVDINLPFASEFSYTVRGNGSKLWHNFYGYPEFGVSYKFFDLGNSNIFGYSHCLYPFISVPLVRIGQKFTIESHIGTGLGYVTKTYSNPDNISNKAISTHINAYITLGLMAKYSLTKRIDLNGGLHLSHFSNGTVKKPNAGLNYSLISVGISHAFQHIPMNSELKYSFSDSDKTNRIIVVGSISQKEVKDVGGEKHWVQSFSVEYSRPIKALWRYGLSLDFMDDASNEYILNYDQIPWESQWQLYKTGIAVSTELIMDRLSAILYFGGYTYNLDSNNGNLYQRLGLRYRFTSRIWAHLALKTHWNFADYIEFGVAVKVL